MWLSTNRPAHFSPSVRWTDEYLRFNTRGRCCSITTHLTTWRGEETKKRNMYSTHNFYKHGIFIKKNKKLHLLEKTEETNTFKIMTLIITWKWFNRQRGTLSLASPSLSLSHTNWVCDNNTRTHPCTNTRFPNSCSSIATLSSCHSLGISHSPSSSPSVRVAHTSCLCTCPNTPHPTHTHTSHAASETRGQAQPDVCTHLFVCHINWIVVFFFLFT